MAGTQLCCHLSAQGRRGGGQVGWRQPQRRGLGGIDDQAEHGVAVGGGGEPQPDQLPGCFGVQVPATPSRALLRDDRDHAAPILSTRAAGTSPARSAAWPRWLVTSRAVQRGVVAQGVAGLGVPAGGELGEGAHGLVVASRQRRLLAELDDRRRRRVSAVRGDVGGED